MRTDDERKLNISWFFGGRKERSGVLPTPVAAYELLDYSLPQNLHESPFGQAQTYIYSDILPDGIEYAALFNVPLTPVQWWELLQEDAPYKNEWPQAVKDDWGAYKSRAKTHNVLGNAWSDLTVHLDLFDKLMPSAYSGNIPALRGDPNYSTVQPDNYILPVSRWKVNGSGERTLITEHNDSPRSVRVEDAIKQIAHMDGLPYEPDRADELAGFALNMLLASDVRYDADGKSRWKNYMSLAGKESDKREKGMNFIGPAQVISRGLMVRDAILANSFYRNAEKLVTEWG